jgi:hypothetical protein
VPTHSLAHLRGRTLTSNVCWPLLDVWEHREGPDPAPASRTSGLAEGLSVKESCKTGGPSSWGPGSGLCPVTDV